VANRRERGQVITPLVLVLLFCCLNAFAAEPSKPVFPLKNTGAPFPFDFAKFGSFTGRGANDYKFKIHDRFGLAKAMGAGLYPNGSDIFKEPGFFAWKKKNPSPVSPWDHVQSGDPESDFYAWTQARDVGPGAKLLFTGQALAEGGHITQALKAYYAVLVFFPREACWSADHSFVWYVGSEALGRIQSLTQHHMEIGTQLQGARFKVINGNDTNLDNDIFVIDPGKWVRGGPPAPVDLSKLKIINQRGYGRVQLVQYENLQWQLRVDGTTMVVHGMTYNPTPVGQHISAYGLHWMTDDTDENGKADAPYDTWVDKNRNGVQDSDEPNVGDFELMKEMGVNAIRLYRTGDGTEYNPGVFKKEVLRDLYHTYGISCIMGEFLGAYTVGSGALWDEGTDYTNPVQLENMRTIIKDYVMDHRTEPYVLMWLLGNENLMPADYSGVNATRTKASVQVEAYLKFVDEIAEMIHRLDPDHPVAVGNLDLVNLEEHAKFAPHVDIFGANAYRGSSGFGGLWKSVQETFDRPLLITEYGCDAYDSRKDQENEKAQADYHEGNWNDIEFHTAGHPTEGNAIGGVIFEYLDEWWKSNQGGWDTHETTKDSAMPFPDGWASEEWYGIISQGEGRDPFLRQPRAAYYLYKDKLWKH